MSTEFRYVLLKRRKEELQNDNDTAESIAGNLYRVENGTFNYKLLYLCSVIYLTQNQTILSFSLAPVVKEA